MPIEAPERRRDVVDVWKSRGSLRDGMLDHRGYDASLRLEGTKSETGKSAA
jgi:hypothetical protein